MQDYGKILDFLMLEREATSRAFETAKHSPFLFLFASPANESVCAWQPLLFQDVSVHPPALDVPVVLPDEPAARRS